MNRVVYVPTLVDAANHNAQVLNARAILGGWNLPGWQVAAHAYNAPDPQVAANPQVTVTRLWRRHAWYMHYFLRYLRTAGLIFYPRPTPMDLAGLRWRRRLGMSAPVVATLEGLVGDATREEQYTAMAGHPVYCHDVDRRVLERIDSLLTDSDHVIAISPFLARIGRLRYGDKFSVLPLGVDSALFFPVVRPTKQRMTVVSAGGVNPIKRPAVFLELARRHPRADFVWYGEGSLRCDLSDLAAKSGLKNIRFPGLLSPFELGEAFRHGDVFVTPSRSEGVPKVTQEAAACGLPQVIFGYYEAPTVVDGHNGFVVWDDQAFFDKVGELIDNRALARAMGQAGADMARAWDWAVVAPQWRARLLEIAERP